MKQISLNEMLNIKGRVSAKEYCATISLLIADCWDEWSGDEKRAAVDAWNRNCA